MVLQPFLMFGLMAIYTARGTIIPRGEMPSSMEKGGHPSFDQYISGWSPEGQQRFNAKAAEKPKESASMGYPSKEFEEESPQQLPQEGRQHHPQGGSPQGSSPRQEAQMFQSKGPKEKRVLWIAKRSPLMGLGRVPLSTHGFRGEKMAPTGGKKFNLGNEKIDLARGKASEPLYKLKNKAHEIKLPKPHKKPKKYKTPQTPFQKVQSFKPPSKESILAQKEKLEKMHRMNNMEAHNSHSSATELKKKIDQDAQVSGLMSPAELKQHEADKKKYQKLRDDAATNQMSSSWNTDMALIHQAMADSPYSRHA